VSGGPLGAHRGGTGSWRSSTGCPRTWTRSGCPRARSLGPWARAHIQSGVSSSRSHLGSHVAGHVFLSRHPARITSACQATHAVCIQSSNVGAGGYGDARAALVGGLIAMAAASSARGHCADVLRDCYATCGQSITPQQQQQQAVDNVCRQLRCADGRPGGWIGKAGTLGREVLVAVQICLSDNTHVVGSGAVHP
jgi:hypothetical protein